MRNSLLLLVLVSAAPASAQVLQLFAPGDLGTNRTVISFDDYPHTTVANTLYQNVGLTFSRDDGGPIPIVDYSQVNRQTTSGSNVIGTFSYPIVGPTQAWNTHLVIDSLRPLNQAGAYFGNDSFFSSFAFQRLSIFGISNDLLGSVQMFVNNNSHVDQFIGIQSDVPFYHMRFENFTPDGMVSPGHAVVLDDLMFTPAVPEPGVWALLGVGLSLGWLMLRRKRRQIN